MIGFCPLASGSKGNSIYVGTKDTKILIDAGISAKMILEKLSEIDVDLEEIDAVVISHEHTDHIKGIAGLCKKLDVPVFANRDTAKGIFQTFPQALKFKIFSTGETFTFGDIEIRPFSVQHDTLDPVAFTLKMGQTKIGICTDLGFVTTLVRTELQQCDYLMVEANHEPSMVHASSRPNVYKQRVLSRQGHLSNEECAKLLVDVYHPGLKHVFLAHLSSECNNPELALQTVEKKLSEHGLRASLSIAHQDQVSLPIHFLSLETMTEEKL